MRRITIVMTIIFYFTTGAFAELPLEEIWSVELDSATALGNAWVDEDGNHNVLVGDGWQAKLVSNGEIIWESDSLIGVVTALLRVPYVDSEQIVVAASEPLQDGEVTYGYIYRFGGEELDLISDMQLLESSNDLAGEYYYHPLVSLNVVPEMLQSEDHPVLVFWDSLHEEFYAHARFYRSTGYYGVAYDESWDYDIIGAPIAINIFQDSDGNTLIAHGWWTDWVEILPERGLLGRYACGVVLFDADVNAVSGKLLSEFDWDQWNGPTPDRPTELLGMTVVQVEEHPSIFVAYSDSSHAFLSGISVPGLRAIQTRSLPDDWQGGQMLSFQWELENGLTTSLLLIDSEGNVLAYDAETLEHIESGSLPEPFVASIATDFDDDGNLKLLVLANDRLICYGISPLEVSKDSHELTPSSLVLSEPYPNPFNARLNINYQVPKAGNVTLKLFDLQGKQVAALMDKMHNTGHFNLTYQAEDLATGMYLVRLTTGTESILQKVVLIR